MTSTIESAPTTATGELPGSRAPARPFTLLDAMALVGTTAIGLWLTRLVFGSEIAEISEADPSAWGTGAYFELVVFSGAFAVPMVTAWTAALLALTFRTSGPARRRWRRPGLVAIATSLPVALVGVFYFLLVMIAKNGGPVTWSELPEAAGEALVLGHGLPGLVVAAAWFVLVLSGRWHPARDWLDRAGRLVG